MEKGLTVKSVDLVFPGVTFKICKFCRISDEDGAAMIFHRHLYYELHFLSSGSYEFILPETTIPVACGELLILPPGVRHFPFRGGAGSESIVLSLAIERQEREEGFYDYFRHTLDQAALKPLRLTEVMIRNFMSFGRDFDGNDIRNYCCTKRTVCDILVDLFDLLNGYDSDLVHTAPGREEERRLLLDCYVGDSNLTLHDIAERMHYSARNVERMIRKTYGMPLGDLRNMQKLKTAERFISEGDTIGRACEKAGFKSTATFRKCFRELEHMTPSEYKKRSEDIDR